MLNANGQTYDTLCQYAETIELDGIPVKTITLEGLLLTKKTKRDKDVADRIVIERALEVFKLHARDDEGDHGSAKSRVK
jgi:predicted nucleotidyltransferase